ncbi:ROK family protein [Streptomyces sp. CMB-StM0423]|uniref:ROK family protein n=1 Tax=Streptomyces sp. CMB-StM0423 TaxID=2059884 RepID=UPI000C711ECA|nr:ROK family protein [Streptomyces sp. CMB-StM0423]AUH41452.1 sugar kinase [Streptomyces sp. CMB-StM0423]
MHPHKQATVTAAAPPSAAMSAAIPAARPSAEDTGLLRQWAAEGGALELRARIVLLAGQGMRDTDIARRLGVSRQTVGTWRHKWADEGIAGLRHRARPGRPATVDEAEVIARTLLASDGAAASRAVGRELGLSHATVAAIRRRWSDHPPADPPLPGSDIWVVGLYADAHGAVLLAGARTGAAAQPRPAGSAVGADVLAGLDRACDALPGAVAGSRPPAPHRALAAFLTKARRRHPRIELYALTLWTADPAAAHPHASPPAAPGKATAAASRTSGPSTARTAVPLTALRPPGPAPASATAPAAAPVPPQPPPAIRPEASTPATLHGIPATCTWRSYLRALVALDSSRHPESSRRVYLDLAGAVEAYARRPAGEPLQWLRESIASHAAPPRPRGRSGGGAGAGRREAVGGANHIDLGSFNECVVIEAVRLAGTVTRGEIAHRTGLTQQSVSRIARSLLARGILVEENRRQATSGKPRTPVRLRGEAAHAVGIHIDPEVFTAVVIDLDGAIVAERTRPVHPTADPDVLVRQVAHLGRGVLADARGAVRPGGFLGIGVAVPGPVDTDSGTVLDPPLMSVWTDLPLLYLLKDHFQCPLIMEKDAAAAAAGERWIGRDRRARDFAYVYLGTGVGSGLYLNGDLHRGTSANAGEFGQLCAVALGRTGPGGRPEVLPECNPPLGLSRLAARHGFPLDAALAGTTAGYRAVTEAAAAGDPAATAAVRDLARAVGQGTTSLVDLLDIDLVVLGGPFFTDPAAPLYLSHIGEMVNDFPTARRLRHVDVERSVLGPEAAAVGAASTIFHAAFTPRLRGGTALRAL